MKTPKESMPEFYIDHETRIRLLENIAAQINKKLDKLDEKIESRFMWLIGLIATSIMLPVVLHAFRLI